MPIYEYRCLECGLAFEKIVSLHTESMTCERCESQNVEKQFSAFAVQNGESASLNTSGPGCNTCGAPRQGMCREMMN
ncbi:MAG: zinc ribbon domain-containing protein [Terriglobia bacterium]